MRKNQDYLRGITNSAKVSNKFGSIFNNQQSNKSVTNSMNETNPSMNGQKGD